MEGMTEIRAANGISISQNQHQKHSRQRKGMLLIFSAVALLLVALCVHPKNAGQDVVFVMPEDDRQEAKQQQQQILNSKIWQRHRQLQDSPSPSMTPSMTVSGEPSPSPSLSTAPSLSQEPTGQPSVSLAPSLSAMPSAAEEDDDDATGTPSVSPSPTVVVDDDDDDVRSEPPSLGPSSLGDEPSALPSLEPTDGSMTSPEPSTVLSGEPTILLTEEPTGSPSGEPTIFLTEEPTGSPSGEPTDIVTEEPTDFPSLQPTNFMTEEPTEIPSGEPTDIVTGDPSEIPTDQPSNIPTIPESASPTESPSDNPTSNQPSQTPTSTETYFPTNMPSELPSLSAILTENPTTIATGSPTESSSLSPSLSAMLSQPPTTTATSSPTEGQSGELSELPTLTASGRPSQTPTNSPFSSSVPSQSPTTPEEPTKAPSSSRPSEEPTQIDVTSSPTQEPSVSPTLVESEEPTLIEPTAVPSASPTMTPTECQLDRTDAIEYFEMVFETFDAAEVSQEDLTDAFVEAYQNERTDACAPILIEVSIVQVSEAPNNAALESSQALNLIDAVTYEIISSQVLPGEGLFPTSTDRIAFVQELNRIFVDEALPVTALLVRDVPKPTPAPTGDPTRPPAPEPTLEPTIEPSTVPSAGPSKRPTESITPEPTRFPSFSSSVSPSASSSSNPTPAPAAEPTTPEPTRRPSGSPSTSQIPTVAPSAEPTTTPQPSRKVLLGLCEKDCDTSDDCEGDLICWQREFDDPPPPGCPDFDTTSREDACIDPDLVPSDPPSHSPSKSPSTSPSVSSTERPSASPSITISASPSKSPSASPSTSPSANPSTSPSTSPSVSPSAQPTVSPQPSAKEPLGICKGDCNTAEDCEGDLICWQRASGDPAPPGCPDIDTSNRVDFCIDPRLTPMPSSSPSAVPSSNPTPQPSGEPSASPSQSPTSSAAGTPRPTLTDAILPPLAGLPAPSAAPSQSAAPSRENPSTDEGAPTTRPSLRPSAAPDLLVQEADLQVAKMILTGVNVLPPDSLGIWADVTREAIKAEVVRILKPESVEVQITVISQNPQSSSARLLQVDDNNSTVAGNLEIQYDVNFLIQSFLEELDPRRYVGGAFDSQRDRDAYVDALVDSGDENFAELTSIQSILEDTTVIIQELERDTPGNDDALDIGVIIASVGAAVAGASLVGMGFYMMRQRQNPQQSRTGSGNVAGLDFFSVDSDELRGMVDTTARPDNDNDVSTLGDPIPQGALSPPMDVSLDDTGAPSLPYDYQVASRGLYAVDEGEGGSPNVSQQAYSDLGSNIEDGDFGTLEDTMDNQYLPNRGQG